ncbi:choice-of-anchor P family protein [Parafrankia discariae]|uniref:choice-of-anchor P family protein n=1 Tax=Parafrankia discariae TaxID=365528 RepID=UPI00039A9197|nr:choice-of-anchor P family protein [Parafrankia discariae]
MGVPRTGSRRLLAGAVTTGLVAAAIGGAMAAPAAAVPNPLAYQDYAFGTYAAVNGVVTSALSFGAVIDCTSRPGVERNAVGSVNIPGVLTGAVVAQSASTSEQAPGAQQVGLTTSTLASASILGGLVGLTGLSVASGAINTGSGIVTNGVVNLGALTVLGIPIPLGTIGPNTTVPIPLLGSITLNEQTPVANGIRTVGVHVHIVAGPNAGLDLYIGFTQSGFGPKPPVFVTGGAYSNAITAGPLSVGPLIAQTIPCAGGLASNSLAGINVPGVLTAGQITAAGGSIPGNPTYGAGVLDIAGVNILSGLITADAIRSQANVVKSPGSPGTLDATGTTFTNLVVAGTPISASVPPNTGIVLPGVGYVILNEQSQFGDTLVVRALHVVITVGGVLPIGAEIELAVAGVHASDNGDLSTSSEESVKPLDEFLDEECAKAADSAKCLGVDNLL